MLLRRINDRKLPPCKAFYAEQTTDSSIAIFKLLCQTVQTVEVWRSLVACFVRDEETGGSKYIRVSHEFCRDCRVTD